MNKVLIIAVLIMVCSCAVEQSKPTIVYVNSYHQGYVPSDEITRAILENLPSDQYNVKVLFMDTKNNGSSEHAEHKASEFMDIIKKEKPQAIIVSDDAAVKYLVKPYLNDSNMPVVFCGVNWSADQYELSKNNITGMLEVLPLAEMLEVVKQKMPDAIKLAVLSENSLSEDNNKLLLDTLYRNAGFEPWYVFVDEFEQWKSAYLSLSENMDIIYLPTNGAISRWNNKEASEFIKTNAVKLTLTCDDFMMDFSVFGLTKVPYEQGEWSAETVKKILTGERPSDIPYVRNVQSKIWLNEDLASKMGFILPDSLMKEVVLVQNN
jgi:ABC-type uncharacterized transport system substrate-binding protein